VRRKHHDLDAWKVAIDLVKDVYALTSSFPPHEIYVLTNQIRRCAVSVPSNIAEGCARLTAKEFIHFLGIARGSLSELDTQLIIAQGLGYLETNQIPSEKLDRLFALISGLISHQRKRVENDKISQ
jgi:four helix bundle protein